MQGYTRKIKDIVMEISVNQIIHSRELYEEHFQDIETHTYYKVLERMVNNHDLVHLTKGLYYRPRKSEFGIIPISQDVIIHYYSKENHGCFIGYHLYNQKGITTQISKRVELISSNLIEDQKTIQNVRVYKISFELSQTTIPIVEMLEILQNYHKIEDLNYTGFIKYVESWIQTTSIDQIEYVLENKKYKKSTIAFMKSILDYYKVNNQLSKYLSPLSKYSFPRMEDIYEFAQK